MKKSLLMLCLGLSTMLVFAGCNKTETVEEPAIQEEVVEEVVEAVEEQEEIEEDLPLPEFRLYNEDGSEYEPVAVTADDIYNRIGELEDKYEFEDDWMRDRAVAFLLYANLEYMTDEDANAIYSDYLENFGFQTIDSTSLDEYKHLADNTNTIPLSAYYIDERLASEAEKLENYYDDGQDRDKLEEAYAEAIKEEPYYYTTLIEAYYRLMPDVENSHDYYEYNDFLDDDCIWTQERTFTSNRNSYESSHVE